MVIDRRDGRNVKMERVGRMVGLGRILQDKFGQKARVIGSWKGKLWWVFGEQIITRIRKRGVGGMVELSRSHLHFSNIAFWPLDILSHNRHPITDTFIREFSMLFNNMRLSIPIVSPPRTVPIQTSVAPNRCSVPSTRHFSSSSSPHSSSFHYIHSRIPASLMIKAPPTLEGNRHHLSSKKAKTRNTTT